MDEVDSDCSDFLGVSIDNVSNFVGRGELDLLDLFDPVAFTLLTVSKLDLVLVPVATDAIATGAAEDEDEDEETIGSNFTLLLLGGLA